MSTEEEDRSTQIETPSKNDVLCGRGASINSHPGNEQFREMVEKRKRVYLTARFKLEKRLIASSIVSEIRALDPPGKFLSKDSATGKWYDIGDEKARDKTSQALRENASSIRAEIETKNNDKRAEIKKAEPEPGVVHSAGVEPKNPAGQNWGYYSYYGFAQHANSRSPSPHTLMPPPPPVPQTAASGNVPLVGQMASSTPVNHYPPQQPGQVFDASQQHPGQGFDPSQQPGQGFEVLQQHQGQGFGAQPQHPSQGFDVLPPWGQAPPAGSQLNAQSATDMRSSPQMGYLESDTNTRDSPVPNNQLTADIVGSLPTPLQDWNKPTFNYGAEQSNAQNVAAQQVNTNDPRARGNQSEEKSVSEKSAGSSFTRRFVHFDGNPRLQRKSGKNLPPRPVMHASSLQLKAPRTKKKSPQPNNQQNMSLHFQQQNQDFSCNFSAQSGLSSLADEMMSSIVEEKSVDSFVDEDVPLDEELEHYTEQVNHADDMTIGSGSIMTRMANSIFGSVGSWAPSIMEESSVAASIPSLFGGQSRQSSTGGAARRQGAAKRRGSFTSMGTSGTSLASVSASVFDVQSTTESTNEVVVVEGHPGAARDAKHSSDERRNPQSENKEKRGFEINWPSDMGSINSWIPNSGPASIFGGSKASVDMGSHVGSIGMGSFGGSVGGGSFRNIFERGPTSPSSRRGGMDERKTDDDDSLVSASSSKLDASDSAFPSDAFSKVTIDDMNWDDQSRE